MCWHKWTKWSNGREGRDRYGYPDSYQYKTCTKCNLIRARWVR
jgi:hypothetical protein